jgi:hypothetical protein
MIAMNLAGIWAGLKSLPWKWICLVMAVVTVLMVVDHRGYSRGKADIVAKYQPVMDRALTNIRTLESNQRNLTSAIDRQNAAVAAAKADGDKRLADGIAALAQAQRANAGLADQAAALRASAGKKPAADAPCVVSDELKKVTKI